LLRVPRVLQRTGESEILDDQQVESSPIEMHMNYSILHLWRKIRDQVGLAGAFATLLMMVSIVIDVVGRYAFAHPIQGVVALNEILMVILLFLGLGASQGRGANVRVEILLTRLPSRIKGYLNIFAWFVGLVVFGSITYFGIIQAYSSTVTNEVKWGVVKFPIWPGRILLSFGVLILFIQLCVNIVEEFRSLRRLQLRKE